MSNLALHRMAAQRSQLKRLMPLEEAVSGEPERGARETIMKAHGCVGVILLFAAAVTTGGATDAPSLSRADREAIITAANQAVHKHRTSDRGPQRGMEIPRSLWGKAIEQLQPLRVLNDRVNVFIVMREDETTEEGFYVSVPISSYAPGHDERFLRFKELTQPGDQTFGRIYECKMKKPQLTVVDDEKRAPQP